MFDKISSAYFEKYIYILALEMASPYQHCANCIGTLLFPLAGQKCLNIYETFENFLRIIIRSLSAMFSTFYRRCSVCLGLFVC